MFGYIMIDKPELKVKEYYRYRAYYCGLCKALKKHYGEVSRLTLNYDMTFLSLLLTSLYEPETEYKPQRCLLHPTQKRYMISNDVLKYTAAVNVILAYYKFIDDWNDDRSIVGLTGMAGLKRAYKKAQNDYKELDQSIGENLKALNKLELEKSPDIDAVSNLFADTMADIFGHRKDAWQQSLRKIGFSFGKYIYLLDALDDLEEDEKKDRYNPLRFTNLEITDSIKEVLYFELGIIQEEMDKLPLLMDKGILDNILYGGIAKRLRSRLDGKDIMNEESGGYDEKSI